jgi:hypothetical protein
VEKSTRRRFLGQTKRARHRSLARRAASFSRLILPSLLLLLLCPLGASRGDTEDDASKQQMQGLDQQVQEIKSDVLGIAAELTRLEERLLYPSNTEVAVFVSLAEGETFRLDSVQIQIDGAPVAHHIYSFKELEALQKGGVQRIYTGNLATGVHQLDVSVAGKRPGGGDFGETERFAFTKEVGPKLVGVTLAGQGSSISLGAW